MKNGRPSNLFPLLRAVNHPLGRNQKAYETHFCAAQTIQFGPGISRWDTRGSSNLPQLKRLINSNMLHLTKQECLPELPPLTRTSHHIPVSSRCQTQYNEAVKDLVSLLPNTDYWNILWNLVPHTHTHCLFILVIGNCHTVGTITR